MLIIMSDLQNLLKKNQLVMGATDFYDFYYFNPKTILPIYLTSILIRENSKNRLFQSNSFCS